jgi:hypothetical protein
LDEIADRTVFHRHIASRTNEIGLRQPQFGHLGVVFLKAYIGPLQFGLVRPFRQYQTQRDAVLNLLQYEVREQ